MEDWEVGRRGRPRRTKGGIRAQSQRGGFARSWWGKRWIEVLENLDAGMRLGRGRLYARGGQVLSIEIEAGEVVASVQGTRADPYQVVIRVQTLTPEAWIAIAQALSGRAVFAARLLAGEMPDGIEEVFGDAGFSLFPSRVDDLETVCSCPDEVNPCKHIAAVHYLLAEEFDRDPFLIFRLRGLPREDIARIVLPGRAPIPEAPHEHAGTAPEEAGRAAAEWGIAKAAVAESEAIPSDPRGFWGEIEGGARDVEDAVRVPAVSAALPKRLGSFPFWRGERAFLPTCELIYRSASQVGMSVFLGEPEAEAGPADDFDAEDGYGPADD